MSLAQVTAFTCRRQRLGRAGQDAGAVLRELVGVYSNHPSAPLTLAARVGSLTGESFRALEGVRVPGLRNSIFLTAPEDGELMFSLSKPRTEAEVTSRLRHFGHTHEQFEALRNAVLETLELNGPQTAAQLKKRLGVRELNPVPSTLARDGLVVRLPHPKLTGNLVRYARRDVGRRPLEEALAAIAPRYLRAFGPARVDDLAWWAGTSKGRARDALALLDVVEVEPGLLLLAGDAEELAGAPPHRGVDLLPKWDALTMGWAPDGRARFVDPDVAARCYSGGAKAGDPGLLGDGLPIVLADGRAVARWELKTGVDFFEAPGARLRAAAERELDRLRALAAS